MSTNFTTTFFGPIGILDIFNLLVSLPIHSYVIWLIVTGTENKVASGFFNLNFSVCEIFNCLNSFLSLLEIWITHTIFQTLIHFLTGLGITGYCLFQCLICVERYLAVVHPVIFLKYKPLGYRVICCTAAWIITLGSCVSCIFIIDLFNIYIWFSSLQFLLFFSIQLFCLVAVLRALKQSGPGEKKREKAEENQMKKRAFYLILITTMCLAITYTPTIISGFLYTLTENLQEIFTVESYCFVLAGLVQPVLYLQVLGKRSCNKRFSCIQNI